MLDVRYRPRRAAVVRLILTFACAQASRSREPGLGSGVGLAAVRQGEGCWRRSTVEVGETTAAETPGQDDGVALLVCAVRSNLARGPLHQ